MPRLKSKMNQSGESVSLVRQDSNKEGWKVVAASVRGASHHRSGAPNQDAVRFWTNEQDREQVVLAVSDGHGSGRHFRSHIGADLAVRTAVCVLQPQVQQGKDSPDRFRIQDLAGEVFQRRLVASWQQAVTAHFKENPFSDEELEALDDPQETQARQAVESIPILAYGATLLVVAANQEGTCFLQLGDGDILIVDREGQTCRPLDPDERLTANQTTSLCQFEAWKEFRTRYVSRQHSPPPALVLVSSDGYANAFRSEEDFLQIGWDYLQMSREEGLEGVARVLPEILSEASTQGSGDDITLGLLLHSPSALQEARPAVLERGAGENHIVGSEEEPPGDAPPVEGAERARRGGHRSASLGLSLGLVALFAAGYLWWAGGEMTWSRAPFRGPTEPGAAPIQHLPRHPIWALSLDSGDRILLEPGTRITSKDLRLKTSRRGKKEEPVAKVIEVKSAIRLQNLSKLTWKTVSVRGRHSEVEPGESLPLQEGLQITLGKSRVRLTRVSDLKGPGKEGIGGGTSGVPGGLTRDRVQGHDPVESSGAAEEGGPR